MHSELFAVSCDAAATPRLDLHLHPRDGAPSASWGVAWYPSDDPNASFMKDTRFRGSICLNSTLPQGERLTTSVLVVHSRVETKRMVRCDAQPFRRPFGRTDCVFAHAGDLELYPAAGTVEPDDWISPIFPPAFEPVGSTDSERVFCRVLQRLADGGGSSIGALGWETLHAWFIEANQHGSLNIIFSNGRDLVAYRGISGEQPLWHTRWLPPRENNTLECGNQTITLDAGEDASRSLMLFTSRPTMHDGWSELVPGEMIVARNGDAVWSARANVATAFLPWREVAETQTTPTTVVMSQTQSASADAPLPGNAHDPVPSIPAAPRTLCVTHETRYQYDDPVHASQHLIRLHPVNDHWQEVIEHTLLITPEGEQIELEDVFGNQAVRLALRDPYTEFVVRMQATVRIDWPNLLNMPHERRTIPLTWMPWQRQMMHAYLLPQELPETQLREISGFAVSFAERRDNDLVETLTDINNTIYRDFSYVSGSTTTETTPFEVYTSRTGVCQDFANLFICMARLLGIPARYRVGYIYTGSNYANKIQSDATHAWAEAYLPHVGWRGFDPTNGCIAGPDHIRVAVGRNFRDATPTSGTIFQGGGGTEMLNIGVEVRELQT